MGIYETKIVLKTDFRKITCHSHKTCLTVFWHISEVKIFHHCTNSSSSSCIIKAHRSTENAWKLSERRAEQKLLWGMISSLLPQRWTCPISFLHLDCCWSSKLRRSPSHITAKRRQAEGDTAPFSSSPPQLLELPMALPVTCQGPGNNHAASFHHCGSKYQNRKYISLIFC